MGKQRELRYRIEGRKEGGKGIGAGRMHACMLLPKKGEACEHHIGHGHMGMGKKIKTLSSSQSSFSHLLPPSLRDRTDRSLKRHTLETGRN